MSESQIIQAPHTLKKAKIGVGPARLDPKAIERAENAVKNMEKDYAIWVQDDLATLEAAFNRARGKPGDQTDDLCTMFRVALDMKGQGASFGYRLITDICDLLAAFLEGRGSLAGLECDVVAAHIATMRAVFAQDVRGDGGATGRALIASLHKLIEKVAMQARKDASV